LSEKKAGKKEAKQAASGTSEPRGPMDVGLLQELVKLMSANDLNTVDLRDGGKRVVLKRGAPVGPMMTYAAPAMASASAAPSNSSPNTSAPAIAANEDAGLLSIKSPMVGTFYAKATPESKPFVTVGTQVDEETDVCVIEAMKVFNNIKAECRGSIAKILVTDGQTVEFGTVLFLVKP
jgi:acetyl-CoA carboxylase biotin carboxyl carrier protein